MAVLTSIRIIRFYRIWLGFSNAEELSAVSFQLSEIKSFNRGVHGEAPGVRREEQKQKACLAFSVLFSANSAVKGFFDGIKAFRAES